MNKRLFRYSMIIFVLGFSVWSLRETGFDPKGIYEGFFEKPFFGQFVRGFYPFNWGILGEVAYQTLVTIQMAWIGTLIATLISLPLSFFAARNIAPTTAIGSSIRFYFNFDRSVDVMIIALLLVSVIGLGPLAGTLAIAVSAIGSMGKLFTEAIEAVDRGPIEALESVGASRVQTIRWAVLPQVLPYLISFFLYRLELNIRSSVVLGIVGAGGVGFLLYNSIKQFQYRDVSMILLVIIALVMTIDAISARLRKMVA